ncbi:MAG TPA: trehalose-phosphatase [Steroidobacteraceae bacterium]|jgi:trehalose 6-phosphate phosphatase|nr:trehalose-phosphatase [Steroidobacteraceae bacterium]
MTQAAPSPSREWCLFLDVDGTLLEIAETPSGVVVDPALKALLAAVARTLNGAVALVSGRSIDVLDELFAPLKLPAAGQHGAERRSATGILVAADPGDGSRSAQLDSARVHLKGFVDSHPGALLEDKGRTIAVHFRQAPELEESARRAVEIASAALKPRYEVQEGKMVLEIKPCGINKGSAVEQFMREAPFRGRTPVFVGDDLTDEPGLRYVERAGGVSIAVGGGIEGQWKFDDPQRVRHWLAAIAALHETQGRS